MHGTSATIRAAGSGPRLERLTGASPEWRPWLTAVSSALDAIEEPPASTADVTPASEQSELRPLLDRAIIRLDGRAATHWVMRLFEQTECTRPDTAGFSGTQALMLIEAAIASDEARLRRLAIDSGLSAEPVIAVAILAAFPILQSAARKLAAMAPTTWPHGYCPVCGAWAALAELRGLERARMLRCLRCGADWQAQWLACVFCGESDHRKLGSLSPEQGAETRRVDKCESCKAYLKTATTLSATPPWGVLLDDAETVDLDLAALDHGYHRPPGHGCHVNVIVEAKA